MNVYALCFLACVRICVCVCVGVCACVRVCVLHSRVAAPTEAGRGARHSRRVEAAEALRLPPQHDGARPAHHLLHLRPVLLVIVLRTRVHLREHVRALRVHPAGRAERSRYDAGKDNVRRFSCRLAVSNESFTYHVATLNVSFSCHVAASNQRDFTYHVAASKQRELRTTRRRTSW